MDELCKRHKGKKEPIRLLLKRMEGVGWKREVRDIGLYQAGFLTSLGKEF